ncbi:hypothetical protein [Vagococcus carniphilus]|uniref:Uncharacterized protein n=1 Tax=Vagococcus carniphilus TaxID=218144 RepID=A0A430B8U0_9ENTE|nr:hypothetical protein [Vagococcus carniphilus]QNN73709.1 hypothetical protein H9L18_03700 [Vagococcus carniphilus]RSU16766.1 hypothetical protein CBF28_00850 [Vagococcus carniphilus]
MSHLIIFTSILFCLGKLFKNDQNHVNKSMIFFVWLFMLQIILNLLYSVYEKIGTTGYTFIKEKNNWVLLIMAIVINSWIIEEMLQSIKKRLNHHFSIFILASGLFFLGSILTHLEWFAKMNRLNYLQLLEESKVIFTSKMTFSIFIYFLLWLTVFSITVIIKKIILGEKKTCIY